MIAVVGIVGFYTTTSVHFSVEWESELSGFSFNFSSSMEWWYHICLILLFVAGVAIGVAGARRGDRGMRAVGWAGAAVNSVCAVLLTLFLAFAAYQGAFR